VLEIANHLAQFESVSYIAYSTGDTDISIQVFARNNSDLFKFVTDVVGKIPGVRKTHISFVPIKIKDDHIWPIPSFVIKKD
jgi:DNA-binding Lrp family transcriptional regulator